MHYQNIDINGVKYEGIDREQDYRNCFPELPKDLAILDIGCNIGFYSLKAFSEGAYYCLGVDNHDRFLDIAVEARDKLGFGPVAYDPGVEFLQADVLNDWDRLEIENRSPFDVILCLNLVHHFQNIEQVNDLFDWMDSIGDKLIFEFLDVPADDEDFIQLARPVNWAIIPNRIGNPKIHLSEQFFAERYPDAKRLVIDSDVTKGRKLIHVTR